MREFALRFLLAHVALLAACTGSAGGDDNFVALKSGVQIPIVSVQQHVGNEAGQFVRLVYETQVDIDSVARLRAEAIELWPQVRQFVEMARYEEVVLSARAPATGICFKNMGVCRYRIYGFRLLKSPGGFWVMDDDPSNPLP
jgi:hypothetical protein